MVATVEFWAAVKLDVSIDASTLEKINTPTMNKIPATARVVTSSRIPIAWAFLPILGIDLYNFSIENTYRNQYIKLTNLIKESDKKMANFLKNSSSFQFIANK